MRLFAFGYGVYMRDSFARRYARVRPAAAALLLLGALAGCGNNNSAYTYIAPNSVVVADFNGDGYPDLAVASAQINQLVTTEQQGFVAVVLQNASSPGTFAASVHYPTDGNPFAMAAGDLNHSGAAGLAVANFNKSTISVLLQTTPNAGTFKPEVSVPTGTSSYGASSPSDVAIADVNGDGYNDLVVADGDISGGGLIVILQNPSSPGTFGAPTETLFTINSDCTGCTAPNSAYGIAAGSLTSTSATAPPDVVLTSWQEATGDDGTLTIFLHDPANPGKFLAPINMSVPGELHRVKIVDVNGDGRPDIVLDNEGPDENDLGAEGIEVLINTTPSGATTPTFDTPITYTQSTATDAPGFYPPISLAVAPLSPSSTLPDIVWTSSDPPSSEGGAGTMQILFNSTTTPGVFDTSNTTTMGSYSGLGNPVSVAIGDLNHSGYPSIATADATGVAVYFQESSSAGTFNAAELVGG